MPQLVKLVANPNFDAKTPEQKEAFKAAKKKGAFEVDYVTAMENIQNSGFMYMIQPEEQAAVATTAPRALEDYSNEELKLLMAQFGIKTDKQMKRTSIISVIRSKMDEVQIIEDEDAPDEQ